MLEEGNPAELYELKGPDLWKQKRGPKNASLEQCGLGKGPGAVKGTFVELPCYFADTDRVQALESRLLICMSALQGFDAAELAKTPFDRGEQKTIDALVAWISSEPRGQKFDLLQSHAQERSMYEAGKRASYFRAGPYDFSCAPCHGEAGKRIRLQDLPDLRGSPGDGVGFAAWPVYRVSSGELWGMQRRLNDRFRQQRFPFPGYAPDVTIALSVFMGVNAKVAKSIGAENLKTVKMPSDGKFIGGWKESEKLAQNGRGMTWNDKSAEPASNGGNCYNCHQISKSEISFGTTGPSLYQYGKQRGVTDPDSAAARTVVEYTWGKLYNAKAYNACSSRPRFSHMGRLDEAQLKDLMALLLDPKSPADQ